MSQIGPVNNNVENTRKVHSLVPSTEEILSKGLLDFNMSQPLELYIVLFSLSNTTNLEIVQFD